MEEKYIYIPCFLSYSPSVVIVPNIGSWKQRMQLLAGEGENVILYDKVQAKRRNNIWTRVCDFRKWKQDR